MPDWPIDKPRHSEARHCAGALPSSGRRAITLHRTVARESELAAGLSLLFVTITAVTSLAFALRSFWFDALMASILKSAGRDATLTGRTYIWDQASRLIDANPAFGLGYNAFWNIGNPDAELIWRFAGITEKRGFNFHNTAMEIMVHLGYVGLTLYGMVVGSLALVLAFRVTRRPDELGTFAVAYLFFMGIRAPVESFGIGAFHYATTLIFAMLSYSLRSPDGPKKATRR